MSSVTLTLVREGPVRGNYSGSLFRPQVWLFAVYDRSTTDVMLSCEYSNQLYMGRLDLTTELAQRTYSSFRAVTWQQVATTSSRLSDHWHIFDHGRHYLSYNDTTSPGTEIYVARVENDLADIGSPTEICAISTTEQVSPGTCGTSYNVSSAAVLMSNCLISLNDHFLIAGDTGVVLVVANQRDNQLVICDIDADLLSGSEVGAYYFSGARPDGTAYPMEAGGSAWRGSTSGGVTSYYFITQGSFDTVSDTDSDIYYGVTENSTWSQPASPNWSISEVDSTGADAFLMFPTIYRFTNGWSVVHYVRIYTSLGYTGGDVVRQLIDASGTPYGTPTSLVNASATRSAARPHVTLVGDYLITTWDEEIPSGQRCFMRIDQVILT